MWRKNEVFAGASTREAVLAIGYRPAGARFRWGQNSFGGVVNRREVVARAQNLLSHPSPAPLRPGGQVGPRRTTPPAHV